MQRQISEFCRLLELALSPALIGYESLEKAMAALQENAAEINEETLIAMVAASNQKLTEAINGMGELLMYARESANWAAPAKQENEFYEAANAWMRATVSLIQHNQIVVLEHTEEIMQWTRVYGMKLEEELRHCAEGSRNGDNKNIQELRQAVLLFTKHVRTRFPGVLESKAA